MKGIKEESISSVLGLLGLGVEELASSSRPCSKRLNGTWDLSSWGYSDNGIQELNQISKGTGCERKEKAFELFRSSHAYSLRLSLLVCLFIRAPYSLKLHTSPAYELGRPIL